MLPTVILSVLWACIAIVLPLVQTLHALESSTSSVRSARNLWLMYWIMLAMLLQVCWLAEWLRMPFTLLYFLTGFNLDILYEVHICGIFYLVIPRWNGLLNLRLVVARGTGRLVQLLLALAARYHLDRIAAASVPTTGTDGGCASSSTSPCKDRPGSYVIQNKTGVTADIIPTKDSIVAQLTPGTVVNVEEVVVQEEEGRVRARIADPAGWISLLNMKTGKRWGVPASSGVNLAGELQGNVLMTAAAAGCNTCC